MPGLLPTKVGHTLHNKKNKIISKTVSVIQYMLKEELFRVRKDATNNQQCKHKIRDMYQYDLSCLDVSKAPACKAQ